MIKNVRNSAKPIKTWLGGACRVPNPFLRKEKTITIRVKEVKRMRIEGANVRTVSKSKISSVITKSEGCSTGETPMVILGRGISWPSPVENEKSNINNT